MFRDLEKNLAADLYFTRWPEGNFENLRQEITDTLMIMVRFDVGKREKFRDYWAYDLVIPKEKMPNEVWSRQLYYTRFYVLYHPASDLHGDSFLIGAMQEKAKFQFIEEEIKLMGLLDLVERNYQHDKHGIRTTGANADRMILWFHKLRGRIGAEINLEKRKKKWEQCLTWYEICSKREPTRAFSKNLLKCLEGLRDIFIVNDLPVMSFYNVILEKYFVLRDLDFPLTEAEELEYMALADTIARTFQLVLNRADLFRGQHPYGCPKRTAKAVEPKARCFRDIRIDGAKVSKRSKKVRFATEGVTE